MGTRSGNCYGCAGWQTQNNAICCESQKKTPIIGIKFTENPWATMGQFQGEGNGQFLPLVEVKFPKRYP